MADRKKAAPRENFPQAQAYQMTLPGMAQTRAPFINVRWNRPFLPAVLDIALDLSGNDLEKICFVFPHARPALYLTELIREDARIAKPCVLPRILPVSALFALARSAITAGRATNAGILDQVALLLTAVRELRAERGGLLRDLPLDDSRRFFPWGMRLANVMEELFIHARVPEDYLYMQDQAAPFAAALLENLGALHTRYLSLLEERGWTTPGLDAFLVARALGVAGNAPENSPGDPAAGTSGHTDFVPHLPALAGKRIILAGFHTLTGSQRAFFRHLWSEHGATVCLHADENVAHGSPHWSCVPLVRWASSWRTRIIPFAHDSGFGEKTPEISFRAGYDVHSQLRAFADAMAQDAERDVPQDAERPLEQDAERDVPQDAERDVPQNAERPLEQNAERDAAENAVSRFASSASISRAVVLPDTSLLLPVLHHLPDTDVNISMGYPLVRSPLFRLVESILGLQEKRRGTGPYAYHWKGLIALLRHPYIKMLVPAPGAASRPAPSSPKLSPNGVQEEEGSLARGFRRFLHHAERVVRSSRRFSRLEDIAALTAETCAQAEGTPPDPAVAALFTAILDATVRAWEEAGSPDELAIALQRLTDLMHDYGKALWTHFPIDAECLYRLTESIIPQLAHTALKEEKLPRGVLFTVLRGLLADERVPFEAYPLVGSQVLGILETRLLHCKNVYLLDATEDKLPGSGAHDPLLPDSLRPLMGLPGNRGRETVAAYNFFRLVNGADHVTVYWQEGVAPSGLNDAKKMRSRFVEELLWREETKRGAILTPEKPENRGEDGPLRLISCMLPPVPRANAEIPATDETRERIREMLQGEVSPSLLDTYLRCPAKFFYQRIGRISEVESVTEGRDPLGTGLFMHDVLRRHFCERLGKPVRADAVAVSELRETFRREMAASPLRESLPPDDRIMLEEAGPLVLSSMLERHEGQIPLFLEEKFTAAIEAGENTRTLSGFIDRVDAANGSLLIMDYKTGHSPLIAKNVWEDSELWNAVGTWNPGDGLTNANAALDLAAGKFSSIQLPVYVYMAGKQTGQPVHDAAYVSLRLGEKDSFLFGPKMDDASRETALAQSIPMLISFLLRHMENATAFLPRPGSHCDWCLYKNLCIVTSR